MSCPSARNDRTRKPPRTEKMKDNNQTYVWKSIKDNPNMYCWLPASLRDAEPGEISLSDINTQDIPPVSEPKDDDAILAESIERASTRMENILRKKVKDGTDPVSSDHPEKYRHVKKFLGSRDVILYGGAAINLYMPRDHKIYKSSAIPDYDVYSAQPWKDATELADYMHNLGYEFCEAKAGIHAGTYKVFVNLWPVADISYLDPEIMAVMETRRISGLTVIPASEIQSAMYRQLATPVNVLRWEKVYERQAAFNEHINPLGNRKLSCKKFIDDKVPDSVRVALALCDKECRKKKLMVGGLVAYNAYVSIAGGTSMYPVDELRYFSEKVSEDIQEVFTMLLSSGIKADDLNIQTTYSPLRPINSHASQIDYLYEGKVYKLLAIADIDICIAYKYVENRWLVSIDFLKYELYLDLAYKAAKNDTRCQIKYITYLQNRYYEKKKISEFDDSPFQRLVPRCIGPLGNPLKTEIMKRWIDRVEGRDRVRVVKPKSDSIVLNNVKGATLRVYPNEPIPENCLDKKEEDCTYPCYWNPKYKRCFGQPMGVYVAGQEELEPIERVNMKKDGWYPTYNA
jgi:hypothetical protein